MTHLEPCPFCGAKAESYPQPLDTWIVWCSNDDCVLSQSYSFKTEQDAADMWNKRAEPDIDMTIFNDE